MRKFFHYDPENPSGFIRASMICVSLIMITFGFFCDPPERIFAGVWKIIHTQAGLITDSMVVGGVGAAFVNAGLVVLYSVVLIQLCNISFSGASVACLFLMGGFALFGKDIWNIQPIIFGGFLYARLRKEPFGKYLYISLFGTALSPMVTEVAAIGQGNMLLRLAIPLLMGVFLGFTLPAIAIFTVRVHQGYNLYNVGFAAGLVGMVAASIFKCFGYSFTERLEWSVGNNLLFSLFLFVFFCGMIAVGFCYNGGSFRDVWRITRHSGRSVADFVQLDGYPATLVNMGLVGMTGALYVLLVGGELNGPTIGAIFTVCGFGAFGKHLRNILPVMAGVVLLSAVVGSINGSAMMSAPSVLLATLFATGLAPISGQYGWRWGIVAGVLHGAVVLNVGFLHGGLNLYNNGFSAGMICIVLVPLIEALRQTHAPEH